MKTVVVTGANRGLGLEFARQYADDGAHVVAACRDPGSADVLRSFGDHVEVHSLDVRSTEQIRALASALDGRPVDVLLCNAATLGGPRSRLHNLDDDAWLDAFRTNVVGCLRVAIELLPNVAASADGRIVVLASRAGLVREAKAGASYIYRSTKSALHTATRMLALDVADRGVVVALLNPGHVQTGIGGKRAPMTTEQSVTAMRSVIESLDLEATGRLWNYDGREISL